MLGGPSGIVIAEVSGADIVDWYNGRKYHDSYDLGTLGSSCMRGGECRDYLSFYAENPGVKMIIATVDGRLVGRAIVWSGVYFHNEGITMPFVDRIYGSDETQAEIIRYAEGKGYIRKRRQSYSYKDGFVFPDGREFYDTISVTVSRPENGMMPYLDTLTFGRDDCECLILTNDDSDYIYSFDSTSGGGLGEPRVRCEGCGEYLFSDDACVGDGEYFCEYCFHERYIVCAECGDTVSVDCALIIGDSAFCSADCAESFGFAVCAECGEWSFNTMETDDETILCEDCAVDAGYKQCGMCREWYHGGETMLLDRRVTAGWHTNHVRHVCHSCRNKLLMCETCRTFFVPGSSHKKVLKDAGVAVCSRNCLIRTGYTTCAECSTVIRRGRETRMYGTDYCSRCAGRMRSES